LTAARTATAAHDQEDYRRFNTSPSDERPEFTRPFGRHVSRSVDIRRRSAIFRAGMHRRSMIALTVAGMYATLEIAGAAVGLVAGNLMRTTIFRHSVSAGEPVYTACPRCGIAARMGFISPRAKCRRCGLRLGPPACILEFPTAGMLAVLAGLLGPRPELVGFAWLAVAGVAMAAIDIAVYRLPNRLTYPAFAVVLVSFIVGAMTGTDPARLSRALLGALVLGICYFVLALAAPGQLGLGEVKLAPLLGLCLGWASWQTLILGGCLAFIISALTSLVLLGSRRITLKSAIPLGPFMLAAAAVALLA
jgi:leader peptidase (prepilin peptidase)/N-methyltransferase